MFTYTYDPLYRLTAANYNNGTYFRYTYDAVGNRLTQTTLTSTITYTYDLANRLVNVGGITYTWDNNGNLLNDGASTYAYDSANRLSTLKQGTSLTYTYNYNGLGDRLQQTINGNTTTYVLDLNAGLTQVLADGTNTYLYGNGRIAQYAGATPAYFLPDALGSVRQLTNSAGQVTLAKSYQPYWSVLGSAGTASSIYGFAGEQTDATNLIFLRARFYGPQWGRFLTADTWGGDYRRPPTLNKWNYVTGNPINRVDPSGLFACGELPDFSNDRCAKWVNDALENMKTHGAVGALLEQRFRERDARLTAFQTLCLHLPAMGLQIIFAGGNDVGGITPPYSLGAHVVLSASYLSQPASDPYNVSYFAHELTHLLLESQEVRSTIAGEVFAYQAQARVTKELGGIVDPRSFIGQLVGIDMASRSQLEQARQILLDATTINLNPFLSPIDYTIGIIKSGQTFTLISFNVYYHDKLAPAGWITKP